MHAASDFGRVYAGAHWPSDVVARYLRGALGPTFYLGQRRAILADLTAAVTNW